MHSLFQLPFHPFLPTTNNKDELLGKMKFNKQRQQLLRKMELLVIDEISMVRCDIMDAIDTILKSVRRKHDVPFGGVQLLCIGDLYQLPPVAQRHEWNILQEYYSSPFFFDSNVIKEQMPSQSGRGERSTPYVVHKLPLGGPNRPNMRVLHILRYPSANALPGLDGCRGPAQDCGERRRNRLGMALLRTRARRRDDAVRDQPPCRARRGDASPDRTGPPPPIVELRDATVVYPGGHVALERVTFALDRGEFAFVVGPTGCGKSTLIKTADPRGRAGRGRGPDRRPRHQPSCRTTARAPPAAPDRHASSRTSSCFRTATSTTTSPTRCR